MADITMCTNKKCKLRKKCYRYLAHPTIYWQAYNEFQCVSEESDGFYDATDHFCRTLKEADEAWRPPHPFKTS